MGRMQLGITVGVGAMALCLVGGCAVRAPKSTGMDQSEALQGNSLGIDEVRGEVVEVDREEGILQVRDQEERLIELRVEAGTPVFFQGGVSSLGEIAEGSPVRAAFEKEGMERIATWVEIPRPDPEARPAREPLEPKEDGGEGSAEGPAEGEADAPLD